MHRKLEHNQASADVKEEKMGQADVAVVGLGYVGLPLAEQLCSAGLRVFGFDVDRAKVHAISSGISPIGDLSDEQLRKMLEGGFRPSSDESVLGEVDTVVICVPTPLSVDGGPDLAAVRLATEATARHLRSEQLVILESTTYPGTTEEVVVPILEESGLIAGRDFNVAFSPERVDPGNEQFGVANTPKVVGGLSQNCATKAAQFYGRIVQEVILAKGLQEAEMAKLIENTYRHVNIALVNEMAQFCHELDIDIWDALRCAASKPFGFTAFYPGPGVGGHCIPIDPNYLAHRARVKTSQPFRLIELAQTINVGMPEYVVRRGQDLLNEHGRSVKGSRVALLGVAYKAGVEDTRESPALHVAEVLLGMGAEVSFHDAKVHNWQVSGAKVPRVEITAAEIDTHDLVIILQSHASYSGLPTMTNRCLILDTRGLLSGHGVERL